jgi:hypothetical protein
MGEFDVLPNESGAKLYIEGSLPREGSDPGGGDDTGDEFLSGELLGDSTMNDTTSLSSSSSLPGIHCLGYTQGFLNCLQGEMLVQNPILEA